VKDAAVLVEEEIFGLEIFDGGVEGVVVENDGARTERSASRLLGRGFSRVESEGMSGCYFALFSPTVTQTPFGAQGRVTRGARSIRTIFRWRGLLGSTESLFVAE